MGAGCTGGARTGVRFLDLSGAARPLRCSCRAVRAFLGARFSAHPPGITTCDASSARPNSADGWRRLFPPISVVLDGMGNETEQPRRLRARGYAVLPSLGVRFR